MPNNPSVRSLISLLGAPLLGLIFLVAPHSVFASANITATSASIAADGKTLTATLSGGTGTGYSPASGVTGITVSQLTNGQLVSLQQASTTISGTTLTIDLAAFIPSGATVTIAVDIASNITDSGSDTTQGQSSVAVTNNSTLTGTTAGASNFSLHFWGLWQDDATGGHDFKELQGVSSYLGAIVNGTDCNVYIYGGETYSITVDGATSTITAPGNTWIWYSLFSGLPDADHTIAVSGRYIDSDNSLDATGGTGFQQSSINGTFLPVGAAPFATYGAIDGSPVIGTFNGYPNTPLWSAGDSGIRFAAAVTDIYAWMYDGSGPVVLYQDGIALQTYTPGGTSNWGFAHLASGLDGLQHEYEILPIAARDRTWIYAVMLSGGTGLAPVTHSSRGTVGWYGTSIIALGSSFSDSRLGDPFIASRAVGLSDSRWGNPSQHYSTVLRDNTSQVTTLSPPPVGVWLDGGVNDMITGVTIGDANTSGTFTGDFKTTLDNLNAGLPAGTKLLCRAIFPSTNTDRAAYNQAEQTAINSYNAESPADPALYIPTDGWISTSTTDLPDGVHPSIVGSAKIANQEIPIMLSQFDNEPAYTATAPDSSYAGSTSGAGDITLGDGATFTGDQTITITSSDPADLITPSVGIAGTGAVTVTPTNGASSVTYTVNRSTTGTSTLTFTNGQVAWTDPTALTYAVTAEPDNSPAPSNSIASGVGIPSGGGGIYTPSPNTPALTPPVCAPGDLFNTETGARCSSSASTSTPTTVTSSSGAPASRWTFDADLQLKSTGAEVKLLQEYLNHRGYAVATMGAGSPGHETPYFGKLTQAALRRFQAAKHITPAIGYFGSITRAYISSH